jgi:CSLREA domain-containing protein
LCAAAAPDKVVCQQIEGFIRGGTMTGQSTTAVAIPGGGRSRQTLVLAAAATVAVLAIVGVLRQPLSGAVPQGPRAAAPELSPQRAAISRLLGADEPSFWAARTRTGLRQRNADQGLLVAFDRSGPLIHSARGTVGIGLSLLRRGALIEPARAAAPLAARNRVSYDRGGGVVEWYANGPFGIEQGVTVAARPLSSERGRLQFVFALRGSLRARIDDGVVSFGRAGSSAALLRYLGLSVTDAGGRALPAQLSLAGARLTIRVNDTGASYPITVDPTVQAVNLTESNGTKTDEFGWSIAQSASGSLVVAGAPGAEVDGSAEGAAYVFVQPSTGWAAATQTAELAGPQAGSYFGKAVAVVGTTIAVGAPYATVGSNNDEGAVYVYAQPANGWANPGPPLELTPSEDGEAEFGSALAASGTQLFVGAPLANGSEAGAVYEFNQPNGGWTTATTQTAELLANGSSALGSSLAADGPTVVAGAPTTTAGSTDAGAAFVFREPATGWGGASPVPAELTASDGTQSAELGGSVAINAASGTIAVGARYHGADYSGAVYVFQEPAAGWTSGTQTAEMTTSGGNSSTGLGNVVAITNAAGTGPPTPPAGTAAHRRPLATPTSAGWSIGVVASEGIGGVFLFPASSGTWSSSSAGTSVTFGISDASPYSLSVGPGGIALGQWIGSQTGGEYTGSAYVIPAAQPLTVNDSGDAPSSDPSGTDCVTDTGTCTLRAAIQAANALGRKQAIDFDIPGTGMPVISPASPLPAVTAQVTIDGGSQPGTADGQPGVELDGSAAGSNADGLDLKGGDSTVEGLIVTGFSGTGISLQSAGGDTVTDDWLGTHKGASGYADVPDGIGIEVDSPDATIGGTTTDDRNVIADAGDPVGAIGSLAAVNRDSPPAAATLESSFLGFGAGIRIGSGGDDAQVEGNWLGLAPDGSRSGPSTPELGHTAMTGGIQVAPAGGAVSGVTISANVVTDAIAGIQVAAESGTAGNVTVQSNVVGPDSAGAVADVIGNAVGIEAQGAVSGLVVGGSQATANTVQGNGLGIALGGVSGASVSGNLIGVNQPLSQLFDSLSGASPNPGLHNVIGIVLADTAHATVTQNQLLGDVIGLLSTSGADSRANQITNNTVGNTTTGSPPSIKDLKGDQLGSIIGILDENAPGDTIGGNTLELTGLGLLAVGGHGVTVQGNTATSNVLGITLFQGAASSIQGNEAVESTIGILFGHVELTPTELKAVGASDAPVTETDQTAAVSSPASESGLALVAPEGGADLTAPGIAALTTGQTPSGATADSRRAPRDVTPGFAANITGNLIGTSASAQNLGNVVGAWLIGDVTGSFATNTVANNGDGGVWVGPSFEGHFPTATISRNSVYSNGADAKANGYGQGLGIDLLGDAADGGINFDVTPNHAGGSVPGPDGLQNYPVLTGSPGSGTTAKIVGILDSGATTNYTVELFASPVCNPSGNGEGKQFLESVPVSTDGGGLAVFSATPDLPAGTGVITATATGPDGTSEFSRCVVLPGCGAAATDTARAPVSAATVASEGDRRRAIGAAPDKPGCTVSAQRRQKELQLKQQIQDLQALRNDYNADKAGQWYVTSVFGPASAFPPTAVLTGPIAGIYGTAALVSEENVAQLETQIATLQKELDSMIQADKKKPAADLASAARGSAHAARAARAAGRLGVIAMPIPIKLVLPADKHRGIRVLEHTLIAQAQLLSLQRAANVTQQRALAATQARNAGAAKRQWLSLASYDEQMAGAWRSIAKLQTTFAKLVAAAAGSRKLTSSAVAKALRRYAGSLPAFAITDARRLGDLAGLGALARSLKAFDPNLLAGPIGKLLIVNTEAIQVPVAPVVQALTNAAAIARSLAAGSG